ncbi:hypothetical protein J3F83DRAFT_755428 [Trichoderma novae-zelandiae]
MPPKKEKPVAGGKKPSASKMVEDRTFGMKNKKGAQAQRQIQQMTANLKGSGSAEERRKAAEKAQREKEKKAAEDAKRETDALLNKPAQIQKVPFGVDPKTVVCIFYKRGDCEKGKKCKFAHDLSIERKTEKKNLYTDVREDEEEQKKQETSADWTEEQLLKVVLSKKGNQKTSTDKVCKYFIQAIEDGKYGWFWICPNGGDKCMYKHALPPGYVNWIGNLTPVTPETFAKWKKERLDKKAAEEQARKAKDNTGRALFESGKWKDVDSEGESEDEDDDTWNLEKLRRETEALRQKKEEERLVTMHGGEVFTGAADAPAEEGGSEVTNGDATGTAQEPSVAQTSQEVPAS